MANHPRNHRESDGSGKKEGRDRPGGSRLPEPLVEGAGESEGFVGHGQEDQTSRVKELDTVGDAQSLQVGHPASTAEGHEGKGQCEQNSEEGQGQAAKEVVLGHGANPGHQPEDNPSDAAPAPAE